MMTQGSVCILALLFCSPAHAGLLDAFSGILGESKSGSKELSFPEFASLFHKHLGEHGKQSPWKMQAEMFMGLLQGMGGQVPADKANETRKYVNDIIGLLTNASDGIYADASTEKNTTEETIRGLYGDLSDYETRANTALGNAETKDLDLAGCYEGLQTIASGHAVHCGAKELPEACVLKNNTRSHRFVVAKKDTWQCNFTATQTPQSCTAAGSPIKVDLAAKRAALMNAYLLWKRANSSCQSNLTAEKRLCHETNNTYWEKMRGCEQKFTTASAALCSFRSKVAQWTKDLTALRAVQASAPTLLPQKKAEWSDINLIICMFKAFRDRQPAMTFQQSDYGTCETEAGNMQWVGEINTMEQQTTQLLSSSRYDTECLKVSFPGGLAERYLAGAGHGRGTSPAQEITFFTKPRSDTNEEIAYTTDGSDGCTQTNAAVVSTVCRMGEAQLSAAPAPTAHATNGVLHANR